MSGFLAFGKYAVFVWPSYGLSFLVLGGAAWLSWRAYARAKGLLARLERAE